MDSRARQFESNQLSKRLVWGIDWLLGRTRGGRNFPVFPDDSFLVSYPRSGNTWARFLLANLMYPKEAVSFSTIEQKIPDVYKNTRNHLARLPRPRILKSHEYFDPRYNKVIYIVRDPRDVAISYYHYQVKLKFIENDYPMDRYVSRFVAGDVDLYGSWADNVVSWLATRQNHPHFLLIRYEDMLINPKQELARMASRIGFQSTPQQLIAAVQLSTAIRMRTLEKQEADQWVTTKRSRLDEPFVRLAKSGQWKSGLPKQSVAEIESAWGHLMKTLGYELATACAGRIAETAAIPGRIASTV